MYSFRCESFKRRTNHSAITQRKAFIKARIKPLRKLFFRCSLIPVSANQFPFQEEGPFPPRIGRQGKRFPDTDLFTAKFILMVRYTALWYWKNAFINRCSPFNKARFYACKQVSERTRKERAVLSHRYWNIAVIYAKIVLMHEKLSRWC